MENNLELSLNPIIKKEAAEKYLDSATNKFFDEIFDKNDIERMYGQPIPPEQESIAMSGTRHLSFYFSSGGDEKYLDDAIKILSELPNDLSKELIRKVISFHLQIVSAGKSNHEYIFRCIKQIKEKLGVDDEFINQASLMAVFYALYDSNFHMYMEIERKLGIPEWVTDLPEMKKSALVCISKNVLYAKSVKEKFSLEETDFFDAVIVGLAKDLAMGNRKSFADKIAKEVSLSETNLVKSAELGISIALRNDSVNNALKIIEDFNFDKNSLSKPEILESAKEGLYKQIENKNGGIFTVIVDRLYVKPDDVSEVIDKAMKNGLVENVLFLLDALPELPLQRLEGIYGLLLYKKELGIPSNKFYEPYFELLKEKDTIKIKGYIESTQSRINGMMSSEKQPESIVNEDGYKELVELIYPNNAGTYTSFHSNESCKDRTIDMSGLKIKPVYEINLGKSLDMVLKDEQSKDEEVLKSIEKVVIGVQTEYEKVGFDKDKILQILDTKLFEATQTLESSQYFSTREEKIYGLLLENLVGNFNSQTLKEIIVSYQFAMQDDIREYIQGTHDQVKQAKNRDYAYLLELREFFADKIVEIGREIITKAQSNSSINELLPTYYQKNRVVEVEREQADKLNKLRVDTIGLEGNLLDRIVKLLENSRGNTVSYDGEGNVILGPVGKAIRGMIFSEQKKASKAIEVLSGEYVNPETIHLGELNLKELLNLRRQISTGEYNEGLFLRYITQSLEVVFEKEVGSIDSELSKYQAMEVGKQNKQRKQLECFITKNHTSAHARAVGGVCVCGDNPEHGEKCMWNLPNYFQLILRDKSSKICQGVVMLHTYNNSGKKILTASFNPSSTYLYKVDEAELFNKLLEQLSEFALANDIDSITVSTNKAIRTNRTGGEFEKALDNQILKHKEGMKLSDQEVFSFHPSYKQQELQVIWTKE